jgi:hypothetical protein
MNKLTQRDIDDFNALPPKEKIKAWESLKLLRGSRGVGTD